LEKILLPKAVETDILGKSLPWGGEHSEREDYQRFSRRGQAGGGQRRKRVPHGGKNAILGIL
jgi:hypothetical protein